MDLSQYKYKAELHTHTSPCSGCSEVSPKDAVKIYADLGYTSIVICNHFNEFMPSYGDKDKAVELYLSDYKEAKEHGQELGINVLLGCEIRFSENCNDYLLFGINENLLYDAYDFIEKGVESFSKWFRRDGRLFIQAHPFRNGMTLIPPALLDGIETMNFHPNHNSRCSMASKYAAEHNMLVTCGTDFHHPGHEAQVALLTTEPVIDSFQLVKILKSRNYLFQTGEHIILPYKKIPEP